MPQYGQSTGTDDGVAGTWLVELDDDGVPLDDDGVPLDDVAFIPVEAMPDAATVSALAGSNVR
jgi:hypothetical protein